MKTTTPRPSLLNFDKTLHDSIDAEGTDESRALAYKQSLELAHVVSLTETCDSRYAKRRDRYSLVNASAPCLMGANAFHLGIFYSRKDIVDVLIHRVPTYKGLKSWIANPRVDFVNTCTLVGVSPLELCIDEDIAQYLVENGCRTGISFFGTPLHYACNRGQVKMVAAFLRMRRGYIDESSRSNETPLHVAADSALEALPDNDLKSLQVAGSQVNREQYEEQCEIDAEMIGLLTAAGATHFYDRDGSGRTPVERAVLAFSAPAVRAFISAGADLSKKIKRCQVPAQNEQYFSLLEDACYKNNNEMIVFLVNEIGLSFTLEALELFLRKATRQQYQNLCDQLLVWRPNADIHARWPQYSREVVVTVLALALRETQLSRLPLELLCGALEDCIPSLPKAIMRVPSTLLFRSKPKNENKPDVMIPTSYGSTDVDFVGNHRNTTGLRRRKV